MAALKAICNWMTLNVIECQANVRTEDVTKCHRIQLNETIRKPAKQNIYCLTLVSNAEKVLLWKRFNTEEKFYPN